MPHPQPPTIPTISALLSAHVSTHLKKICSDALDQASDQATEFYNSVSLETNEVLDEHKADVATIKEDTIAELSRECDEKLVEFKERVTEAIEEVEERVEIHADKVVGRACDILDALKTEMEKKEVRSKCVVFPGAKTKRQVRAVSLPP